MRKHKYLAIAISIVVGTLWLALVMYTISIGRNTAKVISPSIVATKSVQQTTRGVSSVTPFKATSSSFIQHVTPAATSTPAPQATMGSVTMRLHETSSATAHNVGSGLGAGQGVMATTSGAQNNSSRGISSTLAYSGAIYIPIINNAITSVGATEADEIVDQKMGIVSRRKAKMDSTPPTNPLNPFVDPIPIGDVAWILIAILALAYAYIIYRKRARA